jgi:hypothetical protein
MIVILLAEYRSTHRASLLSTKIIAADSRKKNNDLATAATSEEEVSHHRMKMQQRLQWLLLLRFFGSITALSRGSKKKSALAGNAASFSHPVQRGRQGRTQRATTCCRWMIPGSGMEILAPSNFSEEGAELGEEAGDTRAADDRMVARRGEKDAQMPRLPQHAFSILPPPLRGGMAGMPTRLAALPAARPLGPGRRAWCNAPLAGGAEAPLSSCEAVRRGPLLL